MAPDDHREGQGRAAGREDDDPASDRSDGGTSNSYLNLSRSGRKIRCVTRAFVRFPFGGASFRRLVFEADLRSGPIVRSPGPLFSAALSEFVFRRTGRDSRRQTIEEHRNAAWWPSRAGDPQNRTRAVTRAFAQKAGYGFQEG